MSTRIGAALAEELEELARFVGRHQERPESNVPFFGSTPEEVAAEIAAWGPSWFETCLVAKRDGDLVGFIGANVDGELGRAWVHGPFVEPASWHELADRLLERCTADATARGADDHELAGDSANERLGELAGRHGFERRTPSKSLELGRNELARLPPASVPPLEADDEGAFVELHERLFPATYYSGSQLVHQHARREAIVLALVEHGVLTGYAAGRIHATGEGYVDFVGVAEDARGEGRGRRLVTSICRRLLDEAPVSKISLTVYEDNVAALALYDRLGFELAASVVGYRRRR